MAQAVDAVAHHVAHGAGIEIGPDGRGAVLGFRLQHGLCRLGHGIVPGNALELAGALGTLALERMQQPVRMVDALGIARHLLADHAQRVAVVLRAADPADSAFVQYLHLEGAGGGAVMRADRDAGLDVGQDVHGTQYSRGVRRRHSKTSDGNPGP